MDTCKKKSRVGQWFLFLVLVVMSCTSSGCALFEPEPEKPLTVEEVIGQPRPGLTKYSKTKYDR